MDWSSVKRFYRTAAAVRSADGFAVTLDGRPIHTPAGAPFEVPARALAEAVAGEWEAQTDFIRPHSMRLTQLAATAIDRVAPQRDIIVSEILKYGGTDLLCYRAQGPGELVARQEANWTPLLVWAERTYGARLTVTDGILPIDQPMETMAALRDAVENLDDLALAALSTATAATGSLVLGLALIQGEVDANGAFELSQIDESYQIEKWGEDEEAAARRERLLEDLVAVDRFLDLAADN